jgi:hypothetical protein
VRSRRLPTTRVESWNFASASQRSSVQPSRSFNTWANEAEPVELDSRPQRGEFGRISRVAASHIGRSVVEQRELRGHILHRGRDRLGTGEHSLLAGGIDRFSRQLVEAGQCRARGDRARYQRQLAIVESAAFAAALLHIEPDAEDGGRNQADPKQRRDQRDAARPDVISATPPALLTASKIATTNTAAAVPANQIGTVRIASSPGIHVPCFV